MWKNRYGTYDHLSRVKEWSVGGTDEEDGMGVSRMNAPRIIPEAVLRLQITASDPAVSAWVAANAGSGKTHVLAQRVIRLLLDGVEPGKILCITFTKAAAANMANRVFDELRRWTALDDEKLDAAIRRMSNLDPDPARRARARRLFALALETPGGLKVQTIHAFCTRLLHQFPFEAAVAARFDVLDEAAEAQLLGETSLGVLLDATLAPDAPLGRALATAIAVAADRTFKEVVGEAIRKRDAVRAWIDHGGSVDAAVALLCGTLGISADDTLDRVEAEMTEGPAVPVLALVDRRHDPAAGIKERPGAGGTAYGCAGDRGFGTRRHLSRDFLHRQTRSTSAPDHQGNGEELSRARRLPPARSGPAAGLGGASQGRRLP